MFIQYYYIMETFQPYVSFADQPYQDLRGLCPQIVFGPLPVPTFFTVEKSHLVLSEQMYLASVLALDGCAGLFLDFLGQLLWVITEMQ